jgi:hypothetical protein
MRRPFVKGRRELVLLGHITEASTIVHPSLISCGGL